MASESTGASRRRVGDPESRQLTGRQRREIARRAADDARASGRGRGRGGGRGRGRRTGGGGPRGGTTGWPRFPAGRRGVLTTVALVVVVGGLAAGLAVGLTGGGTNSSGPAATIRQVVRSEAADMVVADGSGWVVDDNAGTIRRFDITTGKWRAPAVHVAHRPVSVAFGFGRLWIADSVDNSVVAADPRTGRLVGAPILVGTEPVSVAVGAGGVWVANLGANSVSLIDPARDAVVASVTLPDGAVRVVVGEGAVWVTGMNDQLARLSTTPHDGTIDHRDVTVGSGPIGLTTSPVSVWTANTVSGTVSRVNPGTMTVTNTLIVGGDPLTVAVDGSRLWVGDGRTGLLRAYDVKTGDPVGAPVRLPGTVRRLVVTGGRLWAATANPGTVDLVSPS